MKNGMFFASSYINLTIRKLYINYRKLSMNTYHLHRLFLLCFFLVSNHFLFAQFDKNYMPITFEGNIPNVFIENDSYYKRLKMYQGKLQPEDLLQVDPSANDYDLSLATQGYGVGNWYLYNGDTAKAVEIFEKVTSGKSFSSFGFIAAEAELARMK